jgi:hypothetical protein
MDEGTYLSARIGANDIHDGYHCQLQSVCRRNSAFMRDGAQKLQRQKGPWDELRNPKWKKSRFEDATEEK